MGQAASTRNPYLPPPKPKFGVLAIAALLLGALALCGSVLPISAVATVAVALLGLVVAVIALVGDRKVLASIGAVLCVAALVLSGAAVVDRFAGNRTPSPAAPAPPVRLPFGERHTWPDGRTISVLPPVPYVETSEFSRPPEGMRHVQFAVAVHNGGPDAYHVVTATITVTHRGRVAKQHFGAGDPVPVAQLSPGGDIAYDVVFEISSEPGELQVEVQPAYSQEPVRFTGVL
ncbi:hypothetical protein [Saccharopolyspora flava]|uniref:DUF4352 domain-containing protein n=1 Tax=Saccharopolyspora flava TaxID=95161 RepID=A0A1I6RS51_9PSEU|nr:hypothetical protein [Saccharopolyspora flava]SFS67549.1 hypothetical protein SAMN05660874_02590 [Saccharopolyspora flava]